MDLGKLASVGGWLAIGLGVVGFGLVIAEAVAYPAETCAVWEQASCRTWNPTGPDLFATTLMCALLVTAPTVLLGIVLLLRRHWAGTAAVILAPLAALVALFLLLMTQFSDTSGLAALDQWNWGSWGQDMLQFSTMRAFSLSLVADLAIFALAVAGRRTAARKEPARPNPSA